MENKPQFDAEHQNRLEALANAVRHRLKEENPDDVVRSAQKYFAFLQGSTDETARMRIALEDIAREYNYHNAESFAYVQDVARKALRS